METTRVRKLPGNCTQGREGSEWTGCGWGKRRIRAEPDKRGVIQYSDGLFLVGRKTKTSRFEILTYADAHKETCRAPSWRKCS
jgi:hypothetical protein